MIIKHISLSQANTFIDVFVGQNKKMARHIFSLGCYHNGKLIGIAIVGRPKKRTLLNNNTVEIKRLYGSALASLILYSACIKAARALGYEGIITQGKQQKKINFRKGERYGRNKQNINGSRRVH